MAIKISNLDAISETLKQRDFYFNDLHLDIKSDGSYSTVFQQPTPGNDIEMDYDESAIKNSIQNLFNTRPGQRFLFPTYGLDLHVYLFEAVTEELGQIIGEKIVKSIETFEPRVTVASCIVVAKPEEHEYEITLIVQIPAFNSIATINSTLDIKSKSFVFVNKNY